MITSNNRLRWISVWLLSTSMMLFMVISLHGSPGQDGCSDRCDLRRYFIHSTSLACVSYDKDDCVNCTNARCKDIIGPVLPTCKAHLTERVNVFAYENGDCTARCDLVPNKYVESTQPMGTPTTSLDVVHFYCVGPSQGEG